MTVGGLVAMMGRLGVDALELEYRIPDTMLPALRDALREAGVRVVSVHNFCPFPTRFQKRLTPDGDLFRLSALDPEERALAVQWTLRTIETAVALEAGRVVLHCGRVDMAPQIEALHGFFRRSEIQTPAAEALREALAGDRNRRKPPHLEALKFSLDRLLPVADRRGVRLGLENRYHHHELPGPEDFDALFQAFDGAPLGYWHDTGHAHAAERLGFCAPGELLGRFKDRLIGLHIHDAAGLDDHRPPGTGEIDFSPVAALPPDILQVMELRPGTPEAAVAAGLDHLKRAIAASGNG